MKSLSRSRCALIASLLTVPAVLAQPAWKHVQPWTPPLASHESRVVSCTNRTPFTQIAADDWICGKTGRIVRFMWWGVLNTPAQAQRPFYIAIYRNLPGSCAPDLAQPIYQRCAVPDFVRYVGTDCQDRRVYRMGVAVPTAAAFVQQVDTHYWLQISEADAESVQPNVENFQWSAHRAIKNCEAIQFPPFTQPILDACDGNRDDLAFALQSRDISGTITLPAGFSLRNPFLLSLYDTAGNLLEEMPVELGADGSYTVNPESPEGVYIVELSGNGGLPKRATLDLRDDQINRLDFGGLNFGDLNGDDQISIEDLATLLANFGRMFP